MRKSIISLLLIGSLSMGLPGVSTVAVTTSNIESVQAVEERLDVYSVKEDVDAIVEHIESTNISPTNWIAWVRGRTNSNLESHTVMSSYVKTTYDNLIAGKLPSGVGDLSRMSLSLASAGKNPMSFIPTGQMGLKTGLSKAYFDMSESNYMGRPNMTAWMLLGLNNMKDLETEALWNEDALKLLNLRNKIINDLVSGVANNGGWGLSNNSSNGGVDVTGMCLVALAPYKDRPEVQNVIDSSVEYLRQVRGNDIYNECNNSMSFAMMIWGLSEVGVDVLDGTWDYSGKNPIEEIYAFKVGNEFKWKTTDASSSPWVNEQCYMALISYVASLSDKSVINYNDNWKYQDLPQLERPQPPVEPEEPEIPVEPEKPGTGDNITNNDNSITNNDNSITNNDNSSTSNTTNNTTNNDNTATNNNTTNNNTSNSTTNNNSYTTSNTTHNVSNPVSKETPQTLSLEVPQVAPVNVEPAVVNVQMPDYTKLLSIIACSLLVIACCSVINTLMRIGRAKNEK